jgi:hypothetical protein
MSVNMYSRYLGSPSSFVRILAKDIDILVIRSPSKYATAYRSLWALEIRTRKTSADLSIIILSLMVKGTKYPSLFYRWTLAYPSNSWWW